MEPQDRDQLDDLFEGAWKHYGNIEPRPGLERRILAHLTVARNVAGARPRWAIAFAMVSCVCAVFALGIVAIAHRRSHRFEVAIKGNAAILPSNNSAEAVPTSSKKPESVARYSAPRHKVIAFALAEGSPHLSQFPSQRPLTEQEQLLKQYVRAFPQEATIVAQEQTLREQEFQKLLAAQSSSGDSD